MRRFITSLTGRIFSQLVVLALLMPSLTFALLTRATAQVASPKEFLGVVEFNNLKEPGTEFGIRASAAVLGEFAKSGDPETEVLSQETISRAIQLLGVDSPPKQLTNLLRVGQSARATKIVTGDIVDYRVLSADGGKQARVSLRVVVYDVASSLSVNGAVVKGESTVRPSATDDKTLINDALIQAASNAVREIRSRKLPNGTVLNTLTDIAYINQGSRSGFKAGQSVIVKRGREQVATARVGDVQPDSAQIRIERSLKGIKPGDVVEAIFDVPALSPGFTANGEPQVQRQRKAGNPSGLITTLVVLGLVAVLLGGGNSGGNNGAADVTSEAFMDPTLSTTESAVLISWRVNAFSNSSNKVRWQVWRDDVVDSPVTIADGGASRIQNKSTDVGAFSWNDGRNATGPNRCIDVGTSAGLYRPVTSGKPYQYSVELIQAVDQNDDPNGGGNNGGTNTGGNNGGTTSGTTTTGGTTSGTTSGTTTTGGTTSGTTAGGNTGTTSTTLCYTVSDLQPAQGLATPLNRPGLVAPADAAQLQGNQSFQFQIIGSSAFNPQLEAVLELSASRNFTTAIHTLARKSVIVGTNSFPSVDVSSNSIPAAIRNAPDVFWRVGVRNSLDKPGPKPERSGWGRYIYSSVRSYKPPVGPPPPPL